VEFLYDCVGGKREPCAITARIHELFATAHSSIIIESPYFVMSRELDLTLAQAQARGVQVVVLTNSLASTDHVVTYAGYTNQKRKLLARGTELWEYIGPHHLHAKSVLIDGCVSIVGSHNLDPRSDHLDTQSAIVVRDAGVAENLLDSMALHFACARQVCSGCQPLGAKKRHPEAEPQEIRRLRRGRVVAPLIMRNL
jgi:phosphatidylserine/phosphatidylglycerophosphate/cardiolipin synthase-like enzyme